MIKLREKTGWVFDLDGTLTHSVHDFALIRKELGIAEGQDILACIASQSPEIKRTMLTKLDELELRFAGLAQRAEGSEKLLCTLRDRGCELGILTRNSREVALTTLEAIGFSGYFSESAVLGRDEAPPKPSPVGIEFLINKWSIDNGSTVMVGDFQYDLLSGRRAKVSTVHVDTREQCWPELTDVRVQNLLELIPLL